MQNITLSVDAQAANFFLNAPSEEKKKLQMLVSLLLRQRSQEKNAPSIEEIMDRMSDYAESQGLTEEKLRRILSSDA
ncbi:MAG: hypothetical protein Q8916_08755 [Bacteroidota bacterium]|nr:hypothetical protein [Bacteroidota bacterium]MDP4230476.1 hypothetical protein [Bacteroidota bacterium]MDP4236452.1 hypothetical protein [Bacteroidota bacterium]